MPGQSVFEQFIENAGIRLVNSTDLYPAWHPKGDAGLPLLVVKNSLGRAVIALQGAHLTAFQPAGGREMLWLSPKSAFKAGKAIRGGIPICVPWFGPSADGTLQHGFGRIMEWRLAAVERCADGATRVALELAGDASVSRLWPHAFSFRLEAVVGTSLKLAISVVNRSQTAAPLSFAFHSYFAVPNVADVRVAGLENVSFIDDMDHQARKVQQGEIAITEETDRVYLDVPAVQTLKMATGNVKIESDTSCAVVWNTGANDKNMADVGEGNHVGYLCVERGDVEDHALALPPGGKYTRSMTLSLV